MLRNVEKRGVQAAINVRKTLGAVELSTKIACKKRFVFAGVYPVFLRFVDL